MTPPSLLAANKTPEQIVDQMHSNLETSFGDADIRKAVIGTVAALMMPTLGAMIFGLGTTAMALQITGYNTFFQTAAYNALRYTTSARAASRLMRSLGM